MIKAEGFEPVWKDWDSAFSVKRDTKSETRI